MYEKELLDYEFASQARERRARMLRDRSTVLVSPRFSSVRLIQGRGQVGKVGTLVTQAGIPHPLLIGSREMHKERIEKDIQIAMTLDHTLEDEFQDGFSAGSRSRTSLFAFTGECFQRRITITLLPTYRQHVCSFPENLTIPIFKFAV